MKCYSVPYEGNQEYIFFSYCHEDAPLVYPIIERLSIEGFRVWYDNGIHPGDDWPEVIAAHLSRAKVCVATISKASAESHNCRNEVSFAIANNKPFVSVLIEDFPMPLGMQLQLSSSNYIKKQLIELKGVRIPGKILPEAAFRAHNCRLQESRRFCVSNGNYGVAEACNRIRTGTFTYTSNRLTRLHY